MGFDVAACEKHESAFALSPSEGETNYQYRLRILRYLSAKDIVSWSIADYDAPVEDASGVFVVEHQIVSYEPSTTTKLGLWFFVIAAIGLLILIIFQT